ncbi:MBL fold metallo-hydrolase [Heliorestis acidaminivorans]|uniref:MBL fold metallo-hydrolase n=1 Tax=Heliorestis acidaminivorans TaxID=553427 RepID=A0A6I0EVP9_9FIRM|nr:MBL fold metallo-hydrolase [Heliorestis acidaminivorans]KAB2953669.1 MBL fold metallo-hydrolase [Heliorestis acidaminivorans]
MDAEKNRRKPIEVTFWGVRGSLPVANPSVENFGGNTACVQVQIEKEQYIFDAGSGIYPLGLKLLSTEEEKTSKIHLFLSHVHWDHLMGFPYFQPFYNASSQIAIYGERKQDKSIRQLLEGLMTAPYFPVPLHKLPAQLDFIDIGKEEKIDLPNQVTVETLALHHPNGCLAYRLTVGNCIICYGTDHEQGTYIDQELIAFAEGADLLILDGQYEEAEYRGSGDKKNKKGWGHSTWKSAVKIGQKAQVKRLALFHHDQLRSDGDLEEIEKEAQEQFPQAFCAREGMTIRL